MHLGHSDNGATVAVSVLAGLTTVAVEGGQKLALAFFVALATGAGYKLGTYIVSAFLQKLKKKD